MYEEDPSYEPPPRVNIDASQILGLLGLSKEDLANSVVYSLTQSIRDEVTSAVRKVATESANQLVAESLKKVVDELLLSDFQPVDSWGEKFGPKSTLKEMLKEKSLGFLKEKVDDQGRPQSYNSTMTRGQWYATEAVKKAMDYDVKNEIGEAVKKAKDQLRKQVADYVTQQILSK